jgi:putative DNA primase/helicase
VDGGGDNLDELRAALRADADRIAEALLGVPNKALSTKHTSRWGSKGSLKLELRGTKRGIWHSKESDEGGDLLALIRQQHGCGFTDAVAWARGQTGLPAELPDNETDRARRAQQDADRRARQAEADARGQAEADAQRLSDIAWVQKVARAAVPADNTPASWYLMQVRGIPRPVTGWPDAVRWHSGYRALVLVGTRANGDVQCIQRVHLGASGGKASIEEIEQRGLPAIKATNGPMAGAVVRLPGDPAGPLLLAEGPETGIACWSSTRHETWIALGGIGGVELPAGRRVVAISDDNPLARDAKQGGAARALNKAIAAWRKADVDLVVATPWEARRRDKSDMADVILTNGPDAVRKRIQAALEPGRTVVERLPLADAERQVAAPVDVFFVRVDRLSEARVEWDRQAAVAMAGSVPVEDGDMPPTAPLADADSTPMNADDWADALGVPVQPPEPTTFTYGVRATVGLGKSHVTRDGVGRTLAAMRARDDTHNMVIAVPAHALGDEQAAAWQELPSVKAAGLRVAAWRGRGTPDPAAPGYADPDVSKENKTPMCRDLERVSDVHAVGLSAQTAACKTTIKDSDGNRRTVKCPLFDTCAYQAQMNVRADLWLVAHSSLFHSKPAALGKVAAVIVDEECWRTGLIGTEQQLTLTVDALASDSMGALSGVDRDRLRDLRRQLVAALGKMQNGPVQREAFKSSRLTASSAAEGRALEWERKLDTKAIHPGLTRDERQEAMEALDANRTVARCAMVWDALAALLADDGPAASGWLALDVEKTRDGPARVLRLKSRADVANGWKAPTLLLDALLPVDLVRHFWPDVELVADVTAAMPHQHIYQVTDKAYAKSMLAPLGIEVAKNDPKEAQRRVNRLLDLRALLVREARRWAPGRVLVVVQKDVEKALRELGRLPNNMDLAHHNNIAGVDQWKDVACLVVVGRTLPSPAVVECLAEALTGEAVPPLQGWYERRDAFREMEDGSLVQADADRHPHLLAEMIRWQIAEGQVVQIIGRPRGVRRTAANPAHVLALTDAPLPMPVAGLLDAADLETGPADYMLAEGGVVLENARHAADAYPSLWPSHQAAAKALERGRSRTFPYYNTLVGKCPTPRQGGGGLVEVAYQVAGAGQKPAKAWANLMLCSDPAAFLTERLGRLAWCKVGDVTPPDPPDPDPPPAPRPPPPSPPVADDEPPPGYPAWDRPPMEAQDAWEVAGPMEGGGIAPFVVPEAPLAQAVGPPQNTLQTPRARAAYGNSPQPIEDTMENSILPFGGIDAPGSADRTALADPGSGSAPVKLASYEVSSVLARDVPWLHPEVPAYAVADGGTMLVHRAPAVELRR